MRIEKFIERLLEFEKEHPCCDVVVRREGYISEPVVTYNIQNVGVMAPQEYIQIL